MAILEPILSEQSPFSTKYIGSYYVCDNISWWLMEVRNYVYVKWPGLFGDEAMDSASKAGSG